MTAPDADDVFRIRQTVSDRLIEYWRDVDRFDARNATDFYTPDCIYQMVDHRMQGREAIQRYYDYRGSRGPRLVRHIVSNLYVEVRDPRCAWLEAVLSVHAADGEPVLPSAPPIMVADAECEFVRDDDGIWRMRWHRLVALFKGGVEVLVPPDQRGADR